MKNFKKSAIIVILILLLAIISTLFVACDLLAGEPYYGTYYSGKVNGEIITSMTIDKYYASQDGEQWNYTYQNGVVTLSSGVEIIFAENYQISYIKKNLLWKYGTTYSWDSSIRQRNGYFSDTLYLFDDTFSRINNRCQFYSDGTYEFLHLLRNGYERGNYYLNSGVLTLCCRESLRSDIPANSERYWYIDDNYSIYSGVMIKDASKFAGASYAPSAPDNGNTGGNTGGNNSSQENTYTVIWKNYDGSVLETDYNVPEGSTPTYNGMTPTRAESNGYVYSFTGWSPYVSSIYGNTTYTAQYSSTIKENAYTVTWQNYDGTVLEIDYVAYGGKVLYGGKTPTREPVDGYTYYFIGWDRSIEYSIYSDTTFTAQYEAVLSIPNLPTNTLPLLESANTSFEGDGTETSPYLIKTSAQLLGMGAYADKHFALANDIVLPLNSQDRPNFTPLFSDEKPFNGTFDGRGYTIKNLYIYNTDTYYTGLFASVGESGVVKNLKLADVRIFGANYIGGITGLSFGSITDCEVSGNITYVLANDYQVYIGGIVGRGSLDKCNSTVEIKVFGFNSTCYVGGLAGYSTSTAISDSFNVGNVSVRSYKEAYVYVGGLVGYSSSGSSITSSNNTGAITVDSNSNTYVGGLVGGGYSSITSSNNMGDITVNGGGYTYVGGLVGSGYGSNSLTSSNNMGDITVDSTGNAFVGGLAGDGYCGLITSSNNTGDITVDSTGNAYIGGLVGYSRSGSPSITSSYNTGDITVDSTGNACVGGLVGDSNSSISLTSSYNTGDITVNCRGTYTCVGGLVGDCNGSITSSYNTGDITVDSSSSAYVGGLVGYISSGSSITSSYNTGAITVESNGETYIGGLLGYGSVTIKNSHWLYYEDGAPINAVGYNSSMGVPTNIGATKHTDIAEFYNLADVLNEGLTEPVFEHKTALSLPTLIKKEN